MKWLKHKKNNGQTSPTKPVHEWGRTELQAYVIYLIALAALLVPPMLMPVPFGEMVARNWVLTLVVVLMPPITDSGWSFWRQQTLIAPVGLLVNVGQTYLAYGIMGYAGDAPVMAGSLVASLAYYLFAVTSATWLARRMGSREFRFYSYKYLY